jgi:prophage tail gpP-like protein
MQADGNLVLYTENGVTVWATHTTGEGCTLKLQNDGNLVIYCDGAGAVWATNTGENASELTSSVTQAQAQSGKYQAYQAWLARRQTFTANDSQHDTLAEYAQKCDDATGIHVPSFS